MRRDRVMQCCSLEVALGLRAPRGLGSRKQQKWIGERGIRLRLGAIYRCQRSDQNLVMLRLGRTISGHTDELIDQPRYSLRTP